MSEIFDFSYEFDIGDKLLAYHNGLLYEATCLKRKISDYGEIQYFIHYTGFNSKWDEWADHDEVLAINKINLAHKENLEDLRKNCKKSKRIKKSQKPKTRYDASKSTKRKRGRPKKNVKQSAEPASAKFVKPASVQPFKELVVKVVDILKYPESYSSQFSGPASKQSTEPAVEKSQEPLKTEDSSKPPKRKRGRPKKNAVQATITMSQLGEPAVEKRAEKAVLTREEPDSSQFAEPAVEKPAESSIPSCSSTTQFTGLAVEKSKEQIFAEPDSTQFTELTVEESDFLPLEEPYFLQCTEPGMEKSTKSTIFAGPALTQLSVEELGFQTFAELATAHLAEPVLEQSAKSTVETFGELAAAQLAEPAVRTSEEPWNREDSFSSKPAKRIRGRPKINVEQAVWPSTLQFAEPVVDKSANSALQTFSETATEQIAGPSSAQFTRLATAQFLEPAVGESAIPVVEQSIPFVEDVAAVQAVENIVVNIIPRSKVPPGRPKINVEQAVWPSTLQFAEPVVDKSANSALQTFSETATEQIAGPSSAQFTRLATAQFLESAVGESAIPVVEQSIPFVEDEAAVQAVENIVVNIIPHSKDYAVKLFEQLKLPLILKRALDYDRAMHYTFQKVLKFPEQNFFAQIIYTFTRSSYFIENDNENSSSMFCLTLMQYFNSCVHEHLQYQSEKKFYLPYKGLEYFQKRLNDQNITYTFKNQLNPKRIWCYLYGPMYLLRLIEVLPNRLISNSWYPDYDLETFVHHIEALLRFLADKFDTYFSDEDYIDTE